MELKFILEAVLFSAQKPLSPAELRDVLADAAEHAEEETAKAFRKVKLDDLITALEQLAKEHQQARRSYRLVCVGGSPQVVRHPGYAPRLEGPGGGKSPPARLAAAPVGTAA